VTPMQQFTGFTADDFDVFAIEGLEPRMTALKAGPKLQLISLGQDLAPALGALSGEQLYPIVAQHTRRKVNPPNDTWVAWSANKRGYKMMPHVQVGLWHTHAFIQAGVIYEARGRAEFADNLLADLPSLRKRIPAHFRWLEDYTKPEGIRHADMTDEDFERIAHRLRTRKEADCMVGLSVDRAEVIAAGADFAKMALGTVELLMPVYHLARAPVSL
jgi:uncharacterized protein YktB (UPF0637 family)